MEKVSRRNNDNDVGTLAMLKYGRNENNDVLRFIYWSLLVTNDKSCFGASLLSLGESLHQIWSL